MRRRKKGRRTLFQILFRDFAAVFVLMVMILVSLFFASHSTDPKGTIWNTTRCF